MKTFIVFRTSAIINSPPVQHCHQVLRIGDATQALNCYCNRVQIDASTLQTVYSFSSERRRALALVTRMASCAARSTIDLRFLLDTPCAISAEKVRFIMRRTSSSLTLCTRNFLKPSGQTCLVFLLVPYPMFGILNWPL